MSGLSSLRSSFATLPPPLRGAIWMLFAAAMFACMGGFIRHLASDIHPLVTAFFLYPGHPARTRGQVERLIQGRRPAFGFVKKPL